MRTIVPVVVLSSLVWVRPGVAEAQEASAAGFLGVGMFDDRPATTFDVGVDVAGESYAFGLGARLRYLAGTGVRSEDWDSPSEIARLLRYLDYTGAGSVRATVAVGELGGVRLGHGSIVDGYTSSLDVDHGHVGAQLRAAYRGVRLAAMIDDVIAPRIAGMRVAADLGDVVAATTVAVDMTAPSMDGPVVVPIAGVDLELAGASDDGLFAGALYSDVVASRTGAGLHLGAGGSVALGDTDARLGMRGEVRLATRGHVPGWIGPLYERARRQRVDDARRGSAGGAGGLAEVSLAIPGLGDVVGHYASRPGAPRLATVGVRAPHLRGAQVAMWAAAEVGGSAPSRALAVETRARLPGAMFIVFEVARLYRGDAMDPVGLRPMWIGTAAVGAVVGD